MTEPVLPPIGSSSWIRVWAGAALFYPKCWPCSLTRCQSTMGLSSHGQLPRPGSRREVDILGTTKLLEQQEPWSGFPSLLAMTRACLVNHFSSSLPSRAWVPAGVAEVGLETEINFFFFKKLHLVLWFFPSFSDSVFIFLNAEVTKSLVLCCVSFGGKKRVWLPVRTCTISLQIRCRPHRGCISASRAIPVVMYS